MSRLVLLGLIISLQNLSAAPVPEPATVVKGPLPTFLNLSQAKIADNVISGTRTDYQTVTQSRTVTENVGGRNVTRIERVPVMVPVTVNFQHRLAEYDVVTAEGKTLSLDLALPLLKAAPLILVSDGPLDPAFRKVLARDALILVRKKSP